MCLRSWDEKYLALTSFELLSYKHQVSTLEKKEAFCASRQEKRYFCMVFDLWTLYPYEMTEILKHEVKNHNSLA